jgi:inhibitor of nuclear factor kappa-B kinase subunit alpha
MKQGETINADRYLNILQNHMLPHLPRRHPNIIFMQDGAAPHTALRVRDFLKATFGERVISRHFPWNWPARSPNLNPCDYFLWGYLKARVFMHHPTSIETLKHAIELEIMNVHRDMLRLTVSSLFDCLLCILTCDGGHTE